MQPKSCNRHLNRRQSAEAEDVIVIYLILLIFILSSRALDHICLVPVNIDHSTAAHTHTKYDFSLGVACSLERFLIGFLLSVPDGDVYPTP